MAEKDADDKWRLDLENSLRKAKGEDLLASLDQLEEENEAKVEAEAALKKAQADAKAAGEPIVEATPEDPTKDDPLLKESGNVLLDYIKLRRQVAVAEKLPSETIVQ